MAERPSTTDELETDAVENKASGTWDRFAGSVRRLYGDATGDEFEKFKGDTQKARGWLKQQYGDAEQQLAEFFEEEK